MSTAARIVAAALVSAVAAGCATDGRPYDGLAFDLSDVPPELRVPHPKDMRAIPPCDLLTDAQLVELGLRPDTAQEVPMARGRTCIWRDAADPRNFADAGGSTDLANPGVPGLYVTRHVMSRFEPLVIAGHPGARIDLNPGTGCDVTVGASDDQLLGANGNGAGRPLPDDGCDRSRRMIELILANLPPRR
jgi:hypothetical protein